MIDTQKIIAAAERNMEGTDMFVVGCTCTAGNEVELLIDSDTAVSIDACATLSRTVDEEFDRDEEDFSLTVASAGIGSELKCLRQYRKLIGSMVEVLLKDGTKICAQLEDATAEQLTLSFEEKQLIEGKKRKQLVTVTRAYPLGEIKYTKEYIDFK
ncbi:MAG: ribosome assembly cofactor RimP [Alistipes sp.]